MYTTPQGWGGPSFVQGRNPWYGSDVRLMMICTTDSSSYCGSRDDPWEFNYTSGEVSE